MSTKRKTSRFMALLLTLCMVFTLLPMTALAAPVDNGVSASATSVSPGDTFDVTLKIPAVETLMSNLGFAISFDKNAFEVAAYTMPTVKGASSAFATTPEEAQLNGYISAVYDGGGDNAINLREGYTLTATFRVKADAELKSYDFEWSERKMISFDEEDDSTEYDHNPPNPVITVAVAVNATAGAGSLGGTVSVTGTPTFGQTLTADTSGLDYAPETAGTLSYKWYRGDTEITGATGSTYTLVAEDVGKTIKVEVSNSNNSGSVTSTPTAAVAKADCTAFAVAATVSATADSVTVTNVTTGQEYAISNGAVTSGTPTDLSWKDSGTFTGLVANNPYTVFTRVKETATTKASDAKSTITTTATAGGGTTTPTPITEVAVTNVPTPVVGQPCSTDGITITTDPAGAADVKDFYWFDETTGDELSSSDTFTAGDEYSLCVELKPKADYAFEFNASDTYTGTATFDGVAADMAEKLLGSDTGLFIASEIVTATAGGGTTTPTKEITEVDVSGITLPKLGESPDYEGTLPTGAKYHIASKEELEELGYSENYINNAKNGILWRNYDNEMIEPDSMFDGSSFEYYVDIVLIPENGYVFAANVTATINGEATLVDTENSENNETYYILESDYLKLEIPESAQIKQADVFNIALPVIGETPDYNVTLPAEAKYRLATKEEIAEFADEEIANASQNGVIWRDAENMRPISPDTEFVEGKQYSVGVVLSAKDGYVFVESATGTINDKPELYSEDYSYITGKIFGLASVEFTAQKGYSIIEGADQTWAKGSTDGIEITSDAPFDRFVKVMVDGTELAKAYYTAREGSTKILLKSTYLESLTNREHSIGIVSYLEDMQTTSSASTSFTIQPAAPSVQGDYVTITVKKTVELSGNQAPSKETFTFELKPKVSNVTISGTTIDTDGEGTYTGIITISGDLEQLANTRDLTLTEKDEGKANWTYDATEYSVWVYAGQTGEYEVSVSQATGTAPSADATAEFNNTYNCSSITIPFKKIVALGGSQAPRSTTFTLEYKPFENVDISELIIGGNAIRTNGKGEYDGTITVTGDLDLIDRAGGLIFSEKNDGAANWTYSDKAYIVHVNKMGTGEYQHFVQEYMDPNTNPAPANAIEFTNTYTNNSSSGGGGGTGTTSSYKIVSSTDAGGVITPVGTVRVNEGASQKFDISAKDGYRIADVLVDGKSVGVVEEYTFRNVKTDHTIHVAIVKQAELNKEDHFAFLVGYADGTFAPDRNMTRAEVTTMFARLLTEKMDTDKTYSNTFNDVPANYWAASYIGYMQQFGIVSGYTDGSFKPDAPVTRAEFAAIASRFEKLSAGSKSFSDVPATHWAAKYINFAATRGWVSGYSDGTFRPEKFITRAEVVAVTCRLLERSADQAYIRDHLNELRSFTDVAESHWAYWYAMEAANTHDYTKSSDAEQWTKTYK